MMFPPARRKRLVRSNLQSFEKPPQGSFPIYPAFPLAFGKVIDLAYCSTAIFALQERFANFSRYFLCYIRFLAPSAATDCSHSVSRGTCIPRLSLVYYVQKLDVFNRIDISHRKDGERHGSILRHFDPISRHVARRGVRVLHEKVAQRRCAALADGLCRGRDGRGLGLEPADPRHRAVVGDGETLVSAGVSRLLGRHSLFAAARPRRPAPARQERAGRGAEEPTPAHDDDGAGRHTAQHPRGHGRRRGVCGLSLRQRTDHGGGRAGALTRHRDPEFSRGGDHFAPAARRGHGQSKSFLGRRALGHRRAHRRGADDTRRSSFRRCRIF